MTAPFIGFVPGRSHPPPDATASPVPHLSHCIINYFLIVTNITRGQTTARTRWERHAQLN